uniref:Beta-catenin-like protein 1 N-terminal domain-containing protein n=1 Tax=Trypanosoma congolense (strain IL3000) TaxID=1068625 RepID=G0UZ54_TRYCI|nr:conserved hypothetical protein [Trypanosoma congolense IL3000]
MSSGEEVAAQGELEKTQERDSFDEFHSAEFATQNVRAFSTGTETVTNSKRNTKPALSRLRQQEYRRKEALNTALSPSLAGRRAEAWVKEWDRGSRAVRLRLLEAFLTLHSESNSRRIELDLGDASILFFTRITAWLRLTYKLGVGLRPIILAISVFVRGIRYLTCLIESGGAAALTDTLATSTVSVEDRYEVVLLLLYIANAGRVYREMICEENGVELLIESMQRETDGKILDLLSALLLVLGEGSSRSLTSPVYLKLIQLLRNPDATGEATLYAVRTLHTYQASWDKKYSDSIAANGLEDTGSVSVVGINPMKAAESSNVLLGALFSLLYHDDLRVRVEGSELLILISRNVQLTGKILSHCLDVVDENRLVIEVNDNVDDIHKMRRHQVTFGSTAVKIMLKNWGVTVRREVIVNLMADRSTHFTLLKFLRLLGVGQGSMAVDCCRLLQLLCREAGDRVHADNDGAENLVASLSKFTRHIQDVLGDAIYNVLLRDELREEQMDAIVRSVMSSER